MIPGTDSGGGSAGEEDPSLAKRVADRYLKREVLGEGTYGVVFKAIDTKANRLIVLLSKLDRRSFNRSMSTNTPFDLLDQGLESMLYRLDCIRFFVSEPKSELTILKVKNHHFHQTQPKHQDLEARFLSTDKNTWWLQQMKQPIIDN